MILRSKQRGYLLVTVIMTLFLLASIAVLLSQDSAINANTSNSELEAARAEYVARAGMQHALWRAQNNACMGNVTIPETSLGKDTYDAVITDASSGTLLKLSADQDAWIRSDDVTRNNGTSASNHVRFEAPNVEQVLTRFDISSIDPNAQISSAVAWFHLKAGKMHPEGPITVHEITADWAETAVTWESFAGAYRSAIVGVISAQDTGDVWVQVNLTAQVQAWVNGQPNYGILFTASDEGIHTEYTAREDGTNPPRLEVVIGSGAASPVTLQVKGKLDTGVVRQLKDKVSDAYQPPSNTMLQPDPSGVDDAWITAGQTAWNYGAHASLRVQPNNQQTFIRFDLGGAVPRGAFVTAAKLELYSYDVINSGAIDVHRVTRAWEEGSCFGNCGADDGVTWATYDGTNTWDTPGGDIEVTPAATALPSTSNAWVAWDITELAVDWINGAVENHGVQIIGNPGHAAFYSSDETDPSLRPKLTIEYACECGSACLAPRGTGNILMVVEEKTALGPNDAHLKSLFEDWGYSVTLISDHDNQNTFDGEFANNEVVFVSETVDTTKLGTKLKAATVGVVNTDGWLNDELGFEASDSSNWPVANFIKVTDTSHYITAPFFGGTLEIYDAKMGELAIGSTPAPGVQSLAELNTRSALAVMDVGAEAAGGGTVAGRRVMLPFGRDTSINWTKVNNNGHVILQRSLDWAMNLDNTLRILFVVGISDSLQTRDTSRRDLFASWGHIVTIIDDSATQAEFDAELGVHDVVYVGGTVVAGELDTKLNITSLGVVNEVAGQLDDFGFHGNATANTVSSNKFTATDAGHYITEPFAGGPVTHFTTSLAMPVPSQPAAPGLREVADAGISTGAIASLATGAERWDGGLSPGRRVHLPFGEATVSQLTDDGKALMQRSLEWGGGAGGAGLGKILLIVGNAATPATTDTNRRDLFESWGYTVELIDDGAGELDFKAAMQDAAVVYVSGSVTAGGFLPNLSVLAKPIVNEESYLVSDYGFSENEGYTATYNVLTTSQVHHINEPFHGADATLFTSNITMPTFNGTMSADLMHPGRIASSVTALGAFESGDLSWDGVALPARRVHVPFENADVSQMTADGQTLLERSIAWAAGDGCSRMTPLLMVVGDPASLTAQETARLDLLRTWCYGVTLIDDSAAQAEYDSAAPFNVVAYIPQEIDSSQIATKLRQSQLGVVNEKGALFDDLGFASLGGTMTTLDGTNITDNSHYITSGFSLGDLTIVSPGQQLHNLMASGTLSPDLIVLSDRYGETLPALSVLETGAKLYGTGSAPARRVWLPWGGNIDGTFPIESLNSDGKTILKRSLEWAAGAGCDSTFRLLFVVNNSGSLTVDEIAKRNRFESWCFDVTPIDDGDSQANFDTAADANDVAYISSNAAANTVGNKLTNSAIGIVNEQTELHDDLGFSSDTGSNAHDKIFIEDNTHYISSGYATGWLIITSTSQALHSLEGTVAPGLQNLGQVWISGANYKDGLAVLETGADLYASGNAAGRRVQLPWGLGFDFNTLNTNGLMVTRRALEWAAGGGFGPLAHWKLDETSGTTAVDSEGGHDGTLSGSAGWAPGAIGGGLSLDDNSSLVTVPHDDSLSLTTMTISAWVYSSLLHGWDAIIGKGTSGASNFGLRTHGDQVHFAFIAGGSLHELETTSSPLAKNTWHHVAASFDATTQEIRIYVDGSLIDSATTTAIPEANTEPVRIGESVLGDDWEGVLDDIRLYNRALSDAEISELAQRPPIAHWKLDETSGTIAVDSVGGHDGTLANGPVWAAGQVDGALSFDGSNDRINVPHDSGLNLTSKMTLSAWVFADSLKPFQMVLTKGDNGVAENYWLGTEGNKANFGFVDGGSYAQHTTSGLTLQAGRWHHIAATFDDAANEAKIYVDGTAETFSNTNSPAANSERLIIGSSYYAGESFDGSLDDVRIYDRVLSGTEVASLAGTAGGGGGGGGAVNYEGFAEVNPSTTYGVNVPVPAGTVEGNLLITAIASDEDAADLTAPAGWNTIVVKANGTRVTLGVWWKIASASEPASHQFTSSSYNMKYGWMMRFSGHDPANPIDATSSFDMGSSQNPPVSSTTTTVDNALVLRVGGFDHDDITIDDPGLTGHTPITMDLGGSGLGAVAGGAGYTNQAAAGNTGTTAFALTKKEEYVTGTIAIRPAP